MTTATAIAVQTQKPMRSQSGGWLSLVRMAGMAVSVCIGALSRRTNSFFI
jgi:sulfur relay (sulfurtransferase) complex TusBCD TusD component (DsrE family)